MFGTDAERQTPKPTRMPSSQASVTSLSLFSLQEEFDVYIQELSQPLHAPERQVPLPALDPADVGAVEAQGVSQGLLAQAPLRP